VQNARPGLLRNTVRVRVTTQNLPLTAGILLLSAKHLMQQTPISGRYIPCQVALTITTTDRPRGYVDGGETLQAS